MKVVIDLGYTRWGCLRVKRVCRVYTGITSGTMVRYDSTVSTQPVGFVRGYSNEIAGI